MSKKRNMLLLGVSVMTLAIGTVVAYQSTSADAATASETTAAPPPPPATVTVMEEQNIQIWKDFTGRLQAVDYVEIRPEASGQLQEIRFKDGQTVNKDDILFVIDPAPYQATFERAKANLQAAKNQHELAQKDLTRAAGLVKSEAISKKIFDERQSNSQVTRSQVEAAQAQLKQAQIDLDHAYVKAPISGRISRAEITVGNLIQASSAPVMTTIVSDKGIYADFDVDEKTYLQSIYTVARDNEAQTKIPVEMVLKSATDTTYKGVIQSFDNKIDPKTGTIRVRAYFDNEDQSLLPGMFVNVRLGSSTNESSLLISERAIGTDQDRKFVYVVGTDNKVAYREISPGASINGQRVVLSGLKSGEKVITEGIMKVRPDMVVTPQLASAVTKAATTEPAAE